MGPEKENWNTLTTHPHFEKHLSLSRFEEFRKFLASIDVDEETIQMDPWYQFSGAVDEFSLIHQKRVARSYWISANEPISAWKPRTTDKSGSTKYITCCLKAKPTWTEL